MNAKNDGKAVSIGGFKGSYFEKREAAWARFQELLGLRRPLTHEEMTEYGEIANSYDWFDEEGDYE